MNAARQFEVTDGLGCDLMRIVCGRCLADMGAKVCEPAQANAVSHGICPACSQNFVQGECLEGAFNVRRCGVERADAGSPALPPPGIKSLGTIEAASAPGQELARVKRTLTPAGSPVAVLEHLSHGPAASFSFSARPLFWTVTGYDFARSIAWAKAHGNPVADQIRARRSLGPMDLNF